MRQARTGPYARLTFQTVAERVAARFPLWIDPVESCSSYKEGHGNERDDGRGRETMDGEVLPGPAYSVSNGLPAGDHAASGKQVLHIRRAEHKSVISADRKRMI